MTDPPVAVAEANGTFSVDDSFDSVFEVFDVAVDQGWTDGLPILPPTREAVDAQLATVPGEPSDVVAVLPPTTAEATLELLAVCSVMAGCRPEYFPVVVAAIDALADPHFELYGINTTTNPVAPMLILNGPVRTHLDVNCSYGLLGPGTRANATIGRAISLAMINIAGRVPGVVSKTTHAWPGRYTMCIGEFEEASPWEPLHVEKGREADESCVTVMSPTGSFNIIDMTSQSIEGVLTTIAHSMTGIGSVNMFPFFGLGPMLLMMCPDHARFAHASGFSKDDVRQFLFEATSEIPLDQWPEEYRETLVESGRAVDGYTPLAARPDQFEIVVAGGRGGYHDVFFPTFGDSWPITRAVGSS